MRHDDPKYSGDCASGLYCNLAHGTDGTGKCRPLGTVGDLCVNDTYGTKCGEGLVCVIGEDATSAEQLQEMFHARA